MASQSVSGLSGVLKRLYPQTKIDRVLYEDNPLLGMMAKDEEFYGEDLRLALMYAPTTGRSATFANAQSNKAGASYKGFNLTRVTDYSLFSIDGQAIRAAKNSKGALVNALEAEGDANLHALKRSIAISQYRNGGGAIGKVGSTSTVTLTLSEKADVTNFEVGQHIVTSTTDGTSGSVDAGSETTITGIDRDAGTLTAAANWTTGGDYSDDDFLFTDGDFGAKMSGLEAWCPASAPGATAFFGVDRTDDVTRLGGVRIASNASLDVTIERCLVRAAARLRREGGMADYCFMNPEDVYQLDNELGAKREYQTLTAVNAKGTSVGAFGYSALCLMTPAGMIYVVPDQNVPKAVAWMLTMKTWKLYSLGPAAGWLSEDKNQILRESTSDAYEGRMGGYMNVGCKAPGWNARINLSTVVQATQ